MTIHWHFDNEKQSDKDIPEGFWVFFTWYNNFMSWKCSKWRKSEKETRQIDLQFSNVTLVYGTVGEFQLLDRSPCVDH